jgi:hypothetical protein
VTDIKSRSAAGMAGNASVTTSTTPYLVWLGAARWDGIPDTDRRMADEMARYIRVLLIDPQSSVVTSARRHGTIRGGIKPVLSEVSEQITHLSPVALLGLSRTGIRGNTAPLKTLEYFSAGLPVVSTDLPGSRWLLDDLARADPEPDELMLLASSPAEVVSAVRRMTGPPGIVAGPASGAAEPTARGARCQAFAARHTWANRARQLAATIGLRSVPE